MIRSISNIVGPAASEIGIPDQIAALIFLQYCYGVNLISVLILSVR